MQFAKYDIELDKIITTGDPTLFPEHYSVYTLFCFQIPQCSPPEILSLCTPYITYLVPELSSIEFLSRDLLASQVHPKVAFFLRSVHHLTSSPFRTIFCSLKAKYFSCEAPSSPISFLPSLTTTPLFDFSFCSLLFLGFILVL